MGCAYEAPDHPDLNPDLVTLILSQAAAVHALIIQILEPHPDLNFAISKFG